MSHPTDKAALALLTPSQTIGPFSHEAWRWALEATTEQVATGVGIRIHGVICDGECLPINDAVLEAWLPQAAALEAGNWLPGFRRVASDDLGQFHFDVPADMPRAAGEPIMYVTVFARGLVQHQFTAVFLDDDAGLATSALLDQVPAARRATLIAQKESDGRYRWDIWLQTARETVFFDYC